MTRRKYEVEVELERTQRKLREAEASVADMCRGREHLTQQLGVLRTRAERAEAECANVFSREEACMRDLEAVGTALGWQAGEYTYPGLSAAVADLRARAERAEAGLRKINESITSERITSERALDDDRVRSASDCGAVCSIGNHSHESRGVLSSPLGHRTRKRSSSRPICLVTAVMTSSFSRTTGALSSVLVT